MNAQERSVLEALDTIVHGAHVRAQIDRVARHVANKLARDRTALMAWEPIPLAIYGESLPRSLRSSWVFILRAGATTGAERHPNSHQRMMSYRGTGDLQTGGIGRWNSNPLVSDAGAALEARWISVPTNVWHQAVVPEQDWVVVSFHTVPAHELIEERPDSTDAATTQKRLYVPRPTSRTP